MSPGVVRPVNNYGMYAQDGRRGNRAGPYFTALYGRDLQTLYSTTTVV